MNNQDSFDVRFDHRFRDQDQIFASYSFGDVRSQRPGPLGPLWGGSDCCPSASNSRAQHLGLGYTHTFSPRLLNDLHGGYFPLCRQRVALQLRQIDWLRSTGDSECESQHRPQLERV